MQTSERNNTGNYDGPTIIVGVYAMNDDAHPKENEKFFLYTKRCKG